MGLTSTSFQQGNDIGKHKKRRVLTENLVFSKLQEYGSEMLDVLALHARSSEKEDTRIKAADRLLTHILLKPKEDESDVGNNTDSPITQDELEKVSILLEGFMPKEQIPAFIANAMKLTEIIQSIRRSDA